jgi:hypothetical protein
MSDALKLAVAAPIVGLAIALLLPRRSPERMRVPAPRMIPVVVQRGVDSAHALLAESSAVPRHALATATRGVYLVADVDSLGDRSALVTVGRVKEDDVLVDLTQAGVVALTGEPNAMRRTLRSVWSELRWPAEQHELDVVGVDGVIGLSGLRTLPWSHALTLLERGDERSRPLIVIANAAPTGDEAVRLRAAVRAGRNVGVLLVGHWDGPWMLEHGDGGAVLHPLGLNLAPIGGPAPEPSDDAPTAPPVESADIERDVVTVSVLGPVQVRGRALSGKETELVAFLALASQGATEAQIRTALWPERDVPRGTFNNLVSSTRRHLGTTADGELLLPRVGNGRYRLHPSVRCDLTQLELALGAGDAAAIAACLLAVTGRPFDGWAGTDWPFDDAVVSRGELLISQAAQLLGRSDGTASGVRALTNALRAVPDENLLGEAI